MYAGPVACTYACAAHVSLPGHCAATSVPARRPRARPAALMADATQRLYHSRLVTASVIEKFAIGGGAEMSTATDFRLLVGPAAYIQVRACGMVGPPALLRLSTRRGGTNLTPAAPEPRSSCTSSRSQDPTKHSVK